MKMAKSPRSDPNSFAGKTRISFFMTVILPYLLLVYLFYSGRASIPFALILFSPLILLSILAGFSLIRISADRLSLLEKETARAEKNADSGPVRVEADWEMNEIASHFNAVMERFRQADAELKEQSVQLLLYAHDLSESFRQARLEKDLRLRLSRYVGGHVLENLMQDAESPLAEGAPAIHDVTVMFADIRGFTALAESMPAEAVVAMLNEYFSAMAEIVFDHHGVLDKFVGDQIMAVFGVLPSEKDAALRALKTAVEMQRATAALMENRKERGLPVFSVGIGINSGPAILGNVGCANRMDFTVIGDCVNIAARLQEAAGGGEILIGGATCGSLPADLPLTCRGRLSVKNKVEPVLCYRMEHSAGERPRRDCCDSTGGGGEAAAAHHEAGDLR